MSQLWESTPVSNVGMQDGKEQGSTGAIATSTLLLQGKNNNIQMCVERVIYIVTL